MITELSTLPQKDCAVSILCDDGKEAKKFVSVTCEKDVEKNPVKPNTTASGSCGKSFCKPLKRYFLAMQDKGKN